MDWKIFLAILLVGVALVVVQGIAAWLDGYLTQAQMQSRGVTNGWSFMEHGGMWADVFVISPMVAYFMGKYRMDWSSAWSFVILAIALAASLALGYMYQEGGKVTPEAHTHDGTTTVAGWIHGLFAVAVIWTFGVVYFGLTNPPVSKFDIVMMSLLLTPFFFLGAAKFSKRWTLETQGKMQVGGGIALVWALAAARLYFT